MRRRWKALTALGLVAMIAVGCSAGDSGSVPDRSDAEVPAPAQDPGADEDAAEGTVEREVIYSGSLSLLADDPRAVADEAISIAERVGGFVVLDDRRRSDVSDRADVTLRIPADVFTGTVDDLAALAEERSRRIEAQDVTVSGVDLDAAIASKEASLERVRDLMERATSLDDIIALEDELTARETELASLESARRAMTEAVSFSTITVAITSNASDEDPNEAPDGFLEGLAAGWDAFLTAARALLTVLGVLLPFLAVLAVPAGFLWWHLRRRRRVGVAPTTAAVPGPPVRPTIPPQSGPPSNSPDEPEPPKDRVRPPF